MCLWLSMIPGHSQSHPQGSCTPQSPCCEGVADGQEQTPSLEKWISSGHCLGGLAVSMGQVLMLLELKLDNERVFLDLL